MRKVICNVFWAVMDVFGAIGCYLMFLSLGARLFYRMLRDLLARIWYKAFPSRRSLQIGDFDEAQIYN